MHFTQIYSKVYLKNNATRNVYMSHFWTCHIHVHFLHVLDIRGIYLKVEILCLRVCKFTVLQDNVKLIFKFILPTYTFDFLPTYTQMILIPCTGKCSYWFMPSSALGIFWFKEFSNQWLKILPDYGLVKNFLSLLIRWNFFFILIIWIVPP